MKTSNKSQKVKIILDLPAQRVWKELQEYTIEASNDKKAIKPKKIGHLLDQTFGLLLNRIIRQN
jgi:hypothetical protein